MGSLLSHAASSPESIPRQTKSSVNNSRATVLSVLIALLAISFHAEAGSPKHGRPITGTIGKLRKASTEAADTLGKRLDAGHDWQYRRIQHLLEKLNLRFGSPNEAPIVVPL